MKLPLLLQRALISLTFLVLAAPSLAAQGPEMILHMLDYIRVDYPATVDAGEVVDTDEYGEMQEFSAQVVTMTEGLGKGKAGLVAEAKQLHRAIDNRLPPAKITPLVKSLSKQLSDNYSLNLVPRLSPSLDMGKQLYAQECASCHGVSGNGKGPQAAKLNPAPINFQEMERQQERSIWGLYSAISQGVEGTAMPAFSNLNEGQRWAIAFYVSNFPFSDGDRAKGEALWAQTAVQGWIPDLASLTTITPAEISERFGEDGHALLAYLRSEPGAISAGKGALNTARELLATSLNSYHQGHAQKAYQLALSAYLDGFELSEASLSSVAPALAKEIEQSMLTYRELVRTEVTAVEVERHYEGVIVLLQRADTALSENSLDATMGFVSAYVILLREGLEAILLLAAIAAVLIKLGRRDTLPYLHAGWLGALVMGGATWAVSRYLFTISGAGRELTEGLTALLACGVVLYVGFWLHDKTHTNRWREFIDVKVRNALSGKTLWLISLIAFIAVYREVFETVLFYQALWLQAEAGAEPSLWGGIIAAIFSLLVLGWIILRSSLRLPLKMVFRFNATILFILAVVFAGHGVAGLQEAGWLPVDLISMPSFDLLGIYPTLETLIAQLVVVALVSLILLRQRGTRIAAS